MILPLDTRIGRKMAQNSGASFRRFAAPGFCDRLHVRRASGRAGREHACFNRYPSPSPWSGPSWVRPSFPGVAEGHSRGYAECSLSNLRQQRLSRLPLRLVATPTANARSVGQWSGLSSLTSWTKALQAGPRLAPRWVRFATTQGSANKLTHTHTARGPFGRALRETTTPVHLHGRGFFVALAGGKAPRSNTGRD